MLAISSHLSGCRECTGEHKSLLQVKSILSALATTEPNPAWADSLGMQLRNSSLPFYERWRLRLFSQDAPLSFNFRRVTTAVMLSSLAIFLVSASFDSSVPDADTPAPAAGSPVAMVEFTPGYAFVPNSAPFLANISSAASMPATQIRDFPVERRLVWPYADPMPAFGPNPGYNESKMSLTSFGSSLTAFDGGSR